MSFILALSSWRIASYAWRMTHTRRTLYPEIEP